MGIQTMITKTGARYRVEVMINGLRHSETFKRKNDAESYLKGMEAMRATHSGSNQYQENLKLGKAWTDFMYMKEVAGMNLKSTIKNYKNVALFYQHLFDKDILEITDDELVNVLKNAKNLKTGNLLSRNHLKSLRDTLHQVIRFAADKGFVRKDFSFVLARMDKEIKKGVLSKEGESYTQDEVQKIMATIPSGPYWVKPLFLILIVTGKRIGEIAGLTWDKISFKDRTIAINQMISKDEYHNHLKLDAPPHTIEMDENLLNIFMDIKAFQIMQNRPDTDWVFATNLPSHRIVPFCGEHPCPYKNKPICREIMGKEMKKFMIEAGVRPLRIHDLRRTSATLTYIRHAGDKLVNQIVQDKLNHKSFDVTQKYIKVPKSTINEHKNGSTISDIFCSIEEESPSKPAEKTSENQTDLDSLKMKMKVLELEIQLEELRQKKSA